MEPGPAAEPRTPAPRTGRLAAVGAAALVAAVAGFLIAHSGSDAGNGASLPNSAADALSSVSYPGDWGRRDTAPALGGLRFTDTPEPIALGPRDRPSSGLVIGRTDASGPTLLPRSLLRRLPDPPRPQAVKLSGTEAYRYAGLRPGGTDGRLTVFTIPTTAGVVTAVCHGPASAPPQVTGACERAAGTLEVLGAEPFPLGPSPDYAKTLSGALSRLSDGRRTGLSRLGTAGTQEQQARAARSISRSFARAARSLRLPASTLSPADRPANDAVVAALGRASAAYAGMSAAAAGDSATSYDAAREAVAPAERGVARAVRRLGAAGYDVS